MKRFAPLIAAALIATGCMVNVTNPVLNTKMDNNINASVKTSGAGSDSSKSVPMKSVGVEPVLVEMVQPMAARTALSPATNTAESPSPTGISEEEKAKNMACFLEAARLRGTGVTPSADCLERIRKHSQGAYDTIMEEVSAAPHTPEPTPTPSPIVAARGGS